MALYGGIDLHSTNHVVALLDEQDRVVYQRRLPNELDYTLEQLAPFKLQIQGLAVESTYNWYGLVDGLMEAGYQVQLAHTTEMQQYSGLKYTDDSSDARWLARMLHLGLLPTGYIYPKEERAVRDLLRKRSQLVQSRTAQILAVQGWLCQQTGHSMSAQRIKRLTDAEVEQLLRRAESALVVKSSLAVIRCLGEQIESLERTVQARSPSCALNTSACSRSMASARRLRSPLWLSTGDIGRFPTAGHYAS
jgi:transposase